MMQKASHNVAELLKIFVYLHNKQQIIRSKSQREPGLAFYQM